MKEKCIFKFTYFKYLMHCYINKIYCIAVSTQWSTALLEFLLIKEGTTPQFYTPVLQH